MPGLIQSSELRRGSISFVKRRFSRKGSKARETRVFVYFPTASTAGAMAPVSKGHDLGIKPTQMSPVSVKRDPAAGPPGTVFVVGSWGTKDRVQFCCTTGQTWAEIVIR